MATKKITLKLLIDTKTNKVLFAEASKDFVDFLFFLLSLPMCVVMKLLDNKSMVGSTRNIYKSWANLDETYLQPTIQKNRLLNPKISNPSTKKWYTCNGPNCRKDVMIHMSNVVVCPKCSSYLNKEIKFSPATNSTTTGVSSKDKKDSEGYVKGLVSYMISDDLTVTPMSMISSISMINKYNISHTNVLQEKEVQVGTEEGLELLRISFCSTTVLSDLFLGKEKVKRERDRSKVHSSFWAKAFRFCVTRTSKFS